MIALQVVVSCIGVAAALVIFDAAFRTFVLPRGEPVALTRVTALLTGNAFRLVARRAGTYRAMDRVMAMYGPSMLLAFPISWLGGLWLAFSCMYWGIGDADWSGALHLSASSLFTLGFAVPDGAPAFGLVIAEAATGILFSALLISYLPTIYAAFSRREVVVTQLAVRAGSPPSPVQLLTRAHLAQFMDRLDDVWNQFETWFVELEETHTSLAVLPFFRSQRAEHSWITAAGCVLDAAAIRASVLDLPFSPQAGLCIRSGSLSLRHIADFFDVEHDRDPQPGDPISVSRDEFEEVCDRLAQAGVPLKEDRDQAWVDFRGWRVNYDTVLIMLSSLVMAPPGVWSSDRLTGADRYRVGWRRRHR